MVSHTFYPNLPIFLHRYICHICDISQLWPNQTFFMVWIPWETRNVVLHIWVVAKMTHWSSIKENTFLYFIYEQRKKIAEAWHFCARKDGHFWQKCQYLGSKKFHFGYPTANFKTTFIVPTLPKNDGIVLGFRRLPLLGWFWASFLIWFFSPCILHYKLKTIRTPFSRQV